MSTVLKPFKIKILISEFAFDLEKETYFYRIFITVEYI